MIKELIELTKEEINEELVKINFFTTAFDKNEHCKKILELVDLEFELLENKFKTDINYTKSLVKKFFKILNIDNFILIFRFNYGYSDICLKRKLKEVIEDNLDKYKGYIKNNFEISLVKYFFQKDKNMKELEMEDLELLLREIRIKDGVIYADINVIEKYNKIDEMFLDIFKINNEFLTIIKLDSLEKYLDYKYL